MQHKNGISTMKRADDLFNARPTHQPNAKAKTERLERIAKELGYSNYAHLKRATANALEGAGVPLLAPAVLETKDPDERGGRISIVKLHKPTTILETTCQALLDTWDNHRHLSREQRFDLMQSVALDTAFPMAVRLVWMPWGAARLCTGYKNNLALSYWRWLDESKKIEIAAALAAVIIEAEVNAGRVRELGQWAALDDTLAYHTQPSFAKFHQTLVSAYAGYLTARDMPKPPDFAQNAAPLMAHIQAISARFSPAAAMRLAIWSVGLMPAGAPIVAWPYDPQIWNLEFPFA